LRPVGEHARKRAGANSLSGEEIHDVRAGVEAAGIAPALPYLLNQCVEDAGNDEVLLTMNAASVTLLSAT
jgi:hypothetical protein